MERQILEGCMTIAGFTATQLFRHCVAGAYIYIYIFIFIRVYICICIYIYIYVYMHVLSLESGRYSA